jgi:hypothetical protein
MNFEVLTIEPFEKEAARLSKKYPSFKKDLAGLIESLETNPKQGTSLGNNFYKIRLAITSKRKGEIRWSQNYNICRVGRAQSLSRRYLR